MFFRRITLKEKQNSNDCFLNNYIEDHDIIMTEISLLSEMLNNFMWPSYEECLLSKFLKSKGIYVLCCN